MENNTVLETADTTYLVEMAQALERLESNSDFKKVILDGYLKNSALGRVELLGRPDVKKRGERPEVIEELVAISNLQYYLGMVKHLGGSAKVDLENESRQ